MVIESENLNFEKAAELRDEIEELRKKLKWMLKKTIKMICKNCHNALQ
jgi:protein-arginine kinase activator protein McsA